MKRCENCGKLFDENTIGKYSSGRFCSRSCANTRHPNKDTKIKTSNTLKAKFNNSQKLTRKMLEQLYSYAAVDESLNINMPVRCCNICGKKFYHFKARKTCSPQCNKLWHDKLNAQMRNTKKIKYKYDGQWNKNAKQDIFKYYFLYKTINVINNKYYYGMHMTNNLQDGYLGSGVRLKQAIKKYGKHNFKRIVLQYFSCYKDLVEAENTLITQQILDDPQSYNLTLGGIGGPSFKGHKHSSKTKQKISEALKQN